MPVLISMLRGVNLARHRRMKMDALRAVYQSLGLEDPQSYLQSGNVLFRTRKRDLTAIARQIEKGIEETFGFPSDVILRTTPEMREVVARNPFASRQNIEPNRLLVTFLASDPGEQARERVRALKTDPEQSFILGRELYTYFPNGMARTKFSWPVIEKLLKTSGTGRNWNSVVNLLAMAEKLESSE